MERDLITVNVADDQEDVAQKVARYDLIAIPVVDDAHHMLGIITHDDVLDVMERLRAYTTVFYSTHILDDVQQVSDTVAILNRGELITHGPIEDLLAGSEGPYAVTIVDSSASSRRSNWASAASASVTLTIQLVSPSRCRTWISETQVWPVTRS